MPSPRLAPLLVPLVSFLTLSMSCSTSPSEQAHRQIELAEDVNAHLMAVVIEPFFPRAIDKAHGGFNQSFDRNWNPRPGGFKRFSVFQARCTFAAADLARTRPGMAARYLPYARQGFLTLQNTLWDKESGGFLYGATADGAIAPEYGPHKFTYGQAFCIFASAEYFAASKDPAALKLARDGFRWLEDHGRDKAHGGYYECLTRTGARLGQPGDTGVTPYGNWPLGLKTSNTTLHVLEAYLALYQVDPTPEVRNRLSDLFLLLRDKVIVADTGSLAESFQDDLTPVSRTVSPGHDVEAAHLLLATAAALDLADDTKTSAVTRRLVDNALDDAFDYDRGGIYETASGDRDKRHKIWWAQAESLLALMVMHQRFGHETSRYWDAFVLQWKAITVDFTDRNPVGRIKAVGPGSAVDFGKVDAWTETYHDTRCLLQVAERLRDPRDYRAGK